MANRKLAADLDLSTEEKIKEAARIVFQKKGYSATRTRDIAEEAGINLALLNYYFRSKENLFEIIMMETINGFVHSMDHVLNDENTTLMQKVELIASGYIDFVSNKPDVPLFMLSEIRNNAEGLLKKIPFGNLFVRSVCYRQYNQAYSEGLVKESNAFHFILNLLGMIIFPIVASPLLKKVADISDEDFQKMILERKRLIPIWIKATLTAE